MQTSELRTIGTIPARSAARLGCELRQRPAARPNARRDAWRTRRRGRLRYRASSFMVPMRDFEIVEALHDPRSAARPGCESRQRPAARPNARRDAWRTRRRGRLRYRASSFMVSMRDFEIVEAFHEPFEALARPRKCNPVQDLNVPTSFYNSLHRPRQLLHTLRAGRYQTRATKAQ